MNSCSRIQRLLLMMATTNLTHLSMRMAPRFLFRTLSLKRDAILKELTVLKGWNYKKRKKSHALSLSHVYDLKYSLFALLKCVVTVSL